ncbi:hypothetical protein Q5P01_020219 [Channa striata]|uniref:Uncharacterized protein n=1 Tax=Channa striata TaxID=64152 RepID=A0AA88LZC9_CHASR|nr:hypothetical protein Q5P01_020219 [Channa striata]
MIDSPRMAREEWRGEWSWNLPGAAASCCPVMAPPQCHFTSEWSPSTPGTPSLVSSKLLQSAQALIGLELVWLVTQYQVPEMCYSSIDRPGEQRANPSSSLMPSPVAADATWRPQTLQPARRRRRVPARSQKPMSMSCTEKAFSAGRQAACRPLLSPFGGRV